MAFCNLDLDIFGVLLCPKMAPGNDANRTGKGKGKGKRGRKRRKRKGKRKKRKRNRKRRRKRTRKEKRKTKGKRKKEKECLWGRSVIDINEHRGRMLENNMFLKRVFGDVSPQMLTKHRI